MIGIVAPELREQFGGSANDCDRHSENQGRSSDSDTESCSNTGSDNDIADANGERLSDDQWVAHGLDILNNGACHVGCVGVFIAMMKLGVILVSWMTIMLPPGSFVLV
ncbi:hypothetical protein RIF29_03644 [Crotalaria pallida]|uniref:Uncharacterized protein n=1 Tax=Crotalaria pallida TaxID=3830 RepID=A0AAN9J0C4_CROPI